MNGNFTNPKKTLDAAIDAVRNHQPDPEDMENRAARVWSRIGQAESSDAREISAAASVSIDQIRSCEDYQTLIPDYLAGRLPSARALLLKDHTYECVACRNALKAASGTDHRPKVIRTVRRFNRKAAILAVAAALILAAVLGQAGYLTFLLPVVPVHAMARTIDGQLYKLSGVDMNPVQAGAALKAGEPVRTAASSRAIIELGDGTRIEMRERSQLSLIGTHDGVRVNLDRGSVIVEAAKQRNGHLYVATDDCTVSVVGTVFAVSTGLKGSRVSVLEGEVHVQEGSQTEQRLFPGQQVSTSASLTPVTIAEDISWSRNVDTHLALLRALADVNKFLSDRIPGPQLRFTSTLLPLVPANTVVYGALPNVSSVLGQAYDLFRQKIAQDPLLSTWWAERNGQNNERNITLEEMIQHVRTLGSYLGEEIVVAITGDRSGPSGVIVLANVVNPGGVLNEINSIARTSPQDAIRVLTDPTQLATFTGTETGPVAYVNNQTFVLAGSPKALYDVVMAQQSGRSAFTGAFYSSIAEAYSKGAGMLFAADLVTLFSDAQRSQEASVVGLTTVDRLVIEQKQVSGKTMTRAQLNFNGERTGAAAWLASPAPMGALEFVSPQAYGLVSVVTKDAKTILDEILTLGGPLPPNAITRLQNELGIDIRRDLAEPLGGEFVLAMDGPFLPTPSWKVVAEVYDSARLQSTIEQLVRQVNTNLAGNNSPILTLTSEAAGGQVYYRLRGPGGLAPEMNYTFALGYLILAPSRTLVTQALQYQQNRSSIADSAKFRSLMPADGQDHCSAVLYQNLTEAASSIASYVPSGVGGLSSGQLATLQQTVELTPATLVCATGEPNRIVMGYQGDLAFNVLMLGGLRSMMHTVQGSN